MSSQLLKGRVRNSKIHRSVISGVGGYCVKRGIDGGALHSIQTQPELRWKCVYCYGELQQSSAPLGLMLRRSWLFGSALKASQIWVTSSAATVVTMPSSVNQPGDVFRCIAGASVGNPCRGTSPETVLTHHTRAALNNRWHRWSETVDGPGCGPRELC